MDSLKKCTKCGEEKPLSEFCKEKRNKDGYAFICKPCARLRNKQYQQSHKAQIKAQKKKHYQENCEEIKEKARVYRSLHGPKPYDPEYYLENKERLNGYSKKHYQKNREQVLKRTSEYKKENKELIKERSAEYYLNNKEVILEKTRKYNQDNKEQIKEHKKKYYEDNKEHIAQRSKAYRMKNEEHARKRGREYCHSPRGKFINAIAYRKRRARQSNVEENFTHVMQGVTRKAFHNTCAECGSTEKICVDHFRPLSKGNALTLLNACLLCQACNGSKHSKNPEDYFDTFNYLRIKGIMSLADEYFLRSA